MHFVTGGFKELLNYGNLCLRSSKLETLAVYVLLLPVVFIGSVAIQVTAASDSETGLLASAIIFYAGFILLLPLLMAILIRRVNDHFPGSAWTRLFSQIPDGSFGFIVKISGIWALLIFVGGAIFIFAWPIYILAALLVLILPNKVEANASTFGYIPPPPSVKSSLPPLPVFTSVENRVTQAIDDRNVPIHRQGIFWFAIVAALAVCALIITSDSYPHGDTELPAPAVTELEPSVALVPSPKRSMDIKSIPTGTPSLVPAEGAVEQSGVEGLDPRFNTCGEANDAGYGPYMSGVNPEYDWYIDRDKDGIDCES